MGTSRYLIGVALAASVVSAVARAESFEANGACRDGLPQGVYELRDDAGRLRVLGAYNQGRRTGSFLFWNRAGVRVAHVPFDEDAINGTVSLWYESPALEPQRRLEARYTANRPNGEKRAWSSDGRLRARIRYRDGELVSAEAWDSAGSRLPDQDAAALAARELTGDRQHLDALFETVKAHPPSCHTASSARAD